MTCLSVKISHAQLLWKNYRLYNMRQISWKDPLTKFFLSIVENEKSAKIY